ncbi:hypothetical protein H4R99_006804 [Coemansia sp. RSA 1722]|nr:hypothetical protein LPJ57_002748 [Coemansia sp. RSA 486]KAJ2228917.1 hypothetical protein IWW45_006414 [Coemansia sp. RSA 485]KAJ2591305.1 hypothetical protein H4R99_006804 [Coemansia sp. RSA 1722]
MQSSEIKQPGSSVGDTSQCAFYEQRQGSSPTAYIATAASMVSDQVPEPSAPTLSESEYLRITSSQPYMTEAPSSSRSPLLHQVVDPPPYTPIDGYTDSCSHDSDEFENKTAIAQALD